MKQIFLALIFFLLCGVASSQEVGSPPLRIGILADRPKPIVLERWRPVADYLQGKLARPIELRACDLNELAEAASTRTVDVVVAQPSKLIYFQHAVSLSAALVSVLSQGEGNELAAFGGVIVARADRADIATLADIGGRRVEAVSNDSLGSYQAQILELTDAKVPLPSGKNMLFVGLPQDQIVEHVLNGQADVGFVRTGVLEGMAAEGKLDASQIKVLNRQNMPAFPFALSTRLYPEWAVAVLPQVEPDLAAQLAAALLSFPRGNAKAINGVHGFTIPANYDGVEKLLRRLHLPPYDFPVEITLEDLWQRYALWIVSLMTLFVLLCATTIGLVFLNRRSRRSLEEIVCLREQERRTEAELAAYRDGLEDMVQQRTTALLKSEQRALEILNSSSDGLYGADENGVVTFINPAACALLGIDSEAAIGHNAHALFHHSHPDGTAYPGSECPGLAVLRAGREIRVDNEVYWHADGHAIPVMYACHPTFQNGKVSGAVVSFVDMSAQRTAAEARERALVAAENLARVRREFLANMSHEIRTPLNGVLGFAEIGFRSYDNPAKVRNAFEKIRTTGEQLLGVVNDILDFSRIEAGKLALESGEFRPAELANQCLDIVRDRADAKKLDLHVDCALDSPAMCQGDVLRLRQVLLNLLSNAVKFTESGSVKLDVERQAHWLVFRVSDTGIGMSEDQLVQLFEPFQQADGSITRRFGGAGLGLVISKRLLELMGGDIHVQSQLGKGSVFEFRVPCRINHPETLDLQS